MKAQKLTRIFKWFLPSLVVAILSIHTPTVTAQTQSGFTSGGANAEGDHVSPSDAFTTKLATPPAPDPEAPTTPSER